jgi:type IV secretion system protein TrbL
MACGSWWDPTSIACNITGAIGNAAGGAANSAFNGIAQQFGQAATDALTWLWKEIDHATTIDLSTKGVQDDLLATVTLASALALALFVVQVITSALRQEPAGLLRAVKGLVVATVASAFALATTQLLLTAVDRASNGIVSYTTGSNIEALGGKLIVLQQLGTAAQNPAVLLCLAIVVLLAVVVIWAALMIRKLLIIVAAVLTPLAFSGATADVTRGWVRKWIEFTAAMIASKLLLVIMFMVGYSVLNGAGQAGAGASQTATNVASGCVLLLLCGFAPYIAIKIFHFAGESLHAAHLAVGQARAGVDSAIAAPQKVAAMKSSAASIGGRSGGTRPIGSMPPRTPPAPPKPTDTTTASGTDNTSDPGPPSAIASARTEPGPNTPAGRLAASLQSAGTETVPTAGGSKSEGGTRPIKPT